MGILTFVVPASEPGPIGAGVFARSTDANGATCSIRRRRCVGPGSEAGTTLNHCVLTGCCAGGAAEVTNWVASSTAVPIGVGTVMR